MSYYIDTSAIVAALVVEQHTPLVMRWMAPQPIGIFFISDWTYPEIASALSLKLRTAQITLDKRAAALAAWQVMRTNSFNTLAVTAEHFALAATFVNQQNLGVRAGVALHLAVAAAAGFTLVTLDTTMAKAAPVLGIPVARLD